MDDTPLTDADIELELTIENDDDTVWVTQQHNSVNGKAPEYSSKYKIID